MANKYWNEEGKYQKEYEVLWDTLIPKQGKCEFLEPELLRAISRLYYDKFNNGMNCNSHAFQAEMELLEKEGYIKTRYVQDTWSGSLKVTSGVCDRTIDKIIERLMTCKGKFTPIKIEQKVEVK